MKFKTNAVSTDSVLAITKAIKEKFPNASLEFNLQSDDKVMHVHGVPEDEEHAARIESAIRESGFDGAWLTRGIENK